jgi:hypothetical protein
MKAASEVREKRSPMVVQKRALKEKVFDSLGSGSEG